MGYNADEELDKALKDSGFKKEQNDDYYYRIKEGRMEKRWADGDYSQSSEGNYSWEKHRKGDEY